MLIDFQNLTKFNTSGFKIKLSPYVQNPSKKIAFNGDLKKDTFELSPSQTPDKYAEEKEET